VCWGQNDEGQLGSEGGNACAGNRDLIVDSLPKAVVAPLRQYVSTDSYIR